MNPTALVAVFIFAGAFMTIVGSLYRSASGSYRRGELSSEGMRLLRWAIMGHLTIFLLLAITTFLT